MLVDRALALAFTLPILATVKDMRIQTQFQ